MRDYRICHTGDELTLWYLNALNGLVVHSTSSLLKQLIALNTQIDDFCTLNKLRYKRLDDAVYNVRRSLRERRK